MQLPEWDDPDRRDAALVRVGERIASSGPFPPRELAVLFLLSHGMRHAEIGGTLGVSRATIDRDVETSVARLDAQTSAHAVATALRLGLIS
jgi:DNA-binding NarL/FixJ family response regulator